MNNYHTSTCKSNNIKGRLCKWFTSMCISLRRHQLYRLYKKTSIASDCTPALIYLTNKRRTRGIGLTTMMVKDCIANNYKLYIGHNNRCLPFYVMMFQKVLAETQHEFAEYHPKQIEQKFILTANDLKRCSYAERQDLIVVVDNICTLSDLDPLFSAHVYIANGFVDCPGFNITTA